jgi:hypothetical protein
MYATSLLDLTNGGFCDGMTWGYSEVDSLRLSEFRRFICGLNIYRIITILCDGTDTAIKIYGVSVVSIMSVRVKE